jgi:vacuolar-type H+-ATPase subunit I/STV1
MLNPEKKAIASVIFGIIAVVFCVVIYFSHYLLPSKLAWEISEVLWIVFIYLTLPISIFGLVLGKMGLKSTKRNLATIGIILAKIGIFLWSVRIGFQIWALLQGS